jgi:hypothetical protein
MRSSSAVEIVADPAHSHIISLKLRDLNQLFNSMDPSPFIKDLDDRAEEFIVGWAQEFPPDAHVTLRVHLEQWPTQDHPKELIRQAVRNHFSHRAELTHLEFSALMKQGWTSLLIGLSCLATCLIVSKVLLHSEAGTWASLLQESISRPSPRRSISCTSSPNRTDTDRSARPWEHCAVARSVRALAWLADAPGNSDTLPTAQPPCAR